MAWALRLAVDDLSSESWYQRTPPAHISHLGAAQMKKWQGWSLWVVRMMSGLKKEYMGDRHVLLRASDRASSVLF
jgi:hypothetical protein